VYFGDVDLKGLQIPAAANANARHAGLPDVGPAIPLYELLFEAGCNRPGSPVPESVATEVAAWLGPLASGARDALVGGFRFPQEAVGLELLMKRRRMLDGS
jgi:hypothetical protein